MPTATHDKRTTSDRDGQAVTVTKVGNLTADPELRFSEKGQAYARLRLAVDTPKVAGDWAGERETSFYEVTCFGSLAENVSESLGKGTRVVVTGRGEIRSWTGDDGAEHTEKKILADALGPDLRFATAEVTKVRSKTTTQAPSPASGDEEAF